MENEAGQEIESGERASITGIADTRRGHISSRSMPQMTNRKLVHTRMEFFFLSDERRSSHRVLCQNSAGFSHVSSTKAFSCRHRLGRRSLTISSKRSGCTRALQRSPAPIYRQSEARFGRQGKCSRTENPRTIRFNCHDGFLRNVDYLIMDRDPLYTACFRKMLRWRHESGTITCAKSESECSREARSNTGHRKTTQQLRQPTTRATNFYLGNFCAGFLKFDFSTYTS